MPTDRMGSPFGDDDTIDSLAHEGAYEGADLYADDDDEVEGMEYQDHAQQPMRMAGAPPPIPLQAGPPTQPRMPAPSQTPGAPQMPPQALGQPVTVVAQGVRKDFVSGGEVVRAVDNVSFSLSNRQFVAITGPSGCGKTTLLYILGSLEQSTAGSVIIDGVDVTSLSPQAADQFRRKSIGFVFQSFYLIPNLSAMENVTLPMEIAKVPRKSRRERAEYLLQQVGLDKNRHHHLPSRLSNGQQQRVAIARALANDPAVILADEPTGNLDSNNSKRLVSLLRALAKQGRTIVMVTHDRGIARLADVRMDLVDGRIVRMTTPAESGSQQRLDPAARRQTNLRNNPPATGQRW